MGGGKAVRTVEDVRAELALARFATCVEREELWRQRWVVRKLRAKERRLERKVEKMRGRE